MDLQDVKNYIIKKNLDSESRTRNIIDERTYLYAYLYHFLKIEDLELIGEIFGTKDMHGHLIKPKDRTTIRHALVSASSVQFDAKFIEHTRELNAQIPIVIPEFIYGIRTKRKTIIRQDTYPITINVNKQDFEKYIKSKDPDMILDILLHNMIQQAKRNNRNPNK
jgi:hypothetical protein